MKNRVGLGTFPLAGVFSPITTDDAEKLVKKFIDLGGYYFDTAPLYGNGEIEKLLGRVLRSVPRENYYIGTKTIKHVDENGKLFKSGKYDDVVKQIDNSLLRLNTDYVDLLMVHQPDESVPIEETLKAMEHLQKVGKVKELAVSNVDLDELKEYNQTGKIKYVQNRFSLISRSLSPEFEKYLLDNQIYLLPYHLLEIGLLTGIAFEKYKLREGDLREKLSYWSNENQKVIFEWVRNSLAPISKKLGITIGQLNQAWALHQSFIDYIVVGTTNPEYLQINLNSSDIKLNRETLAEIETVYKKLEENIKQKYGQTMREFRGLNEKFY
ncbi:aldo/keto reductase [Candidatus Shapirobacteria bacterium]|nr:aldo/keto reductase [Candidatus Shapirobacteria bacterium]